jgi:hypothetical protein
MASGAKDDAQDAARKRLAHLREATSVSPAASSSNFSGAPQTRASAWGERYKRRSPDADTSVRLRKALAFGMELKLDSPDKSPSHALMNDQSMMTRDYIMTPTPTLTPHTNDAKYYFDTVSRSSELAPEHGTSARKR